MKKDQSRGTVLLVCLAISYNSNVGSTVLLLF